MGNFKLCYIWHDLAFFTTQELDKQWGDDWNDAPYEHNAGSPYEWNERRKETKWEIEIVKFSTYEMNQPCDGHTNSPYSVEMINNHEVAWLAPTEWAYKGAQPIYAGVSIEEFERLIWLSNGTIWIAKEKDYEPKA